MNTIGKILVVLNLVFALVVGGFLVIDFATRSNWKLAFDNLKREMEVAQKNTNISGGTLQDLNTQVKRAEAERDKLKKELVDQENVASAKLAGQTLLTNEANERAKDADLTAQKAIQEKDKLKEELKGLSATVQERDNRILALQESNKTYRTEGIAHENKAKATQDRNVNLLEQIQELSRKLALQDAGVRNDNILTRDPNAPNPPSNYIKGKVDKVDPRDPTLVQISLGSDQGLKQNQTLEVYRLGPDPQYLGRIRIEDVREHVAVGKLVRNSVVGNRPFKTGDIVASSINPQGR